jgi:imidazolonepropionase-like amidohydrolase
MSVGSLCATVVTVLANHRLPVSALHRVALLAVLALLTACSNYPVGNPQAEVSFDRSGGALPLSPVPLFPVVEVTVNGMPGFRFIVDTGATPTAIFLHQGTRRLGLQGTETIGVGGAGGDAERAQAFLATDVDLEIGPVALRGMTVAVLPAATLPPLGTDADFAVDGVIGYDLFSRFAIEVDTAAATLRFLDSGDLQRPSTAVELPLEVRAYDAYVQLPVVLEEQREVLADLHLDTGMTGWLSLIPDSAPALKPPESGWLNTGRGVQGDIQSLQQFGNAVRLGDKVLGPFLTSYSDDGTSMGRQGRLGSRLLSRFTYTVDYPGQRLLLVPRADSFREPERGYLGLWGVPHQGGMRVWVVQPGSPADLAGMQPGHYLTVNGEPFAGMSWPAMHDALNGTPDTVIELCRATAAAPDCRTAVFADAAVAPPLVPAQTPVVVRDVSVLNFGAEGAVLQTHQSVVIAAGAIQEVGATDSVEVPPGAQEIAANGQVLMPGLVDMHVHVWDEAELPAYLAYGVTTVRNASGMPFLLDLGAAVAAGHLAGPDIVTTGPILNGSGPNAQPNHVIVDTAADARAAVLHQYAQGFRHLKVYSNLAPEAYAAILATAAELGMSVMGHTPEGPRLDGIPAQRPFVIPFASVLDDGLASIEHVESIVWHGLGERLDETAMCQLAKDIAAAGVPVTSTLVAHHNLLRVARSDGAYLQRRGADTLNPFITQLEQPVYRFWSAQPADYRAEHDAFYLRATDCLYRAGVTLLAGSDAGIFVNVPGLSLLDELELLQASGLPLAEVLRAATVNPAQALGRADSNGRVAAGFEADLMLLPGNPLQDLSVLRQPVAVISDGRWYDRDARQRLLQQATAGRSVARSEQRVLQAMAAQGTSLEGVLTP